MAGTSSIGRLTLDLVVKAGAFIAGMNKAERDAEKSLSAIEKRAYEFGKNLGTIMRVVAVGAVTAFVASMRSSINAMDDMSKAAQRAGMSTEEFSKLAYAGKLADVSMQDLETAMGRLARAQAASLKSSSEQGRIFEALGISVTDATGSLRDGTEILYEFADAFKRQQGSPEIVAAGMAIFGRSFQNLIPLLKNGSEGLKDAGAELEAFGGVLSTEAGNNAEEFNDNLTRLQTAAMSLGQAVAADLLPDLLRLSERFVGAATDGDRVAETAKSIGDAFRTVGSIASGVASVFNVVGVGLATIAAQATAAAKILKGEFREGLELYKIASQGFDQALADARSGGSSGPGRDPRFAGVTTSVTGTAIDKARAAEMRKAAEEAARLRKLAFGDTPKTGGAKAGKSDAEKEAERLLKSYESLAAQQKERIALYGLEGEEVKLRYQIEHGALQGLDQAKAKQLLMDAQHIDLLDEAVEMEQIWADISSEHARFAEDRTEAFERTNEAILQQIEMMGMSRDEQEIFNNLLWAGVEAESERGQIIIANTRALQEQRELMDDQVEAMDAVRNAGADFLSDWLGGTKSFKESFMDALESIHQRILKMISERLMEQLLGKQGDPGGGAGGDWLGSLFGAFFGGSRAGGGSVNAGKFYRVNENTPEILSVGNQDYLMMGANSGKVSQRATGGGATVVQNLMFQGRVDRRNAQQLARETAQQQRIALARNG